MYDSTKEYVDKDAYLEFAGIDLDIELKNSNYDNTTSKTKIFLKNIQTWLYNYMVHRYDTSRFSTDYEDWDDDTFKEALLWQVKRVLKMGEDEQLDRTAYNILKQHAMANPKRLGGY